MEGIRNLNPRNPLSIIALFVSFCYLTISIVMSLNITYFSNFERECLVFFICMFPIIIFVAFIFLVVGFHEHLYSPKDFRTDKAFYGITADDNEIKTKREEEIENNFCFTAISSKEDRIVKLDEYESKALQIIERKYSLFLRRNIKIGNFIFDAIGISNDRSNYLIEVKVCPNMNLLHRIAKRMVDTLQQNINYKGFIPMLVLMNTEKKEEQKKISEIKDLFPSLIIEVIDLKE